MFHLVLFRRLYLLPNYIHFKYPSTYLYSTPNDLPNMKLLFCKSQLHINQDSLALQLCLGYNGATDPFQNNE